MKSVFKKKCYDLACEVHSLFLFKGKNNRGDMDVETIIKLIILVILIIVALFGVGYLLWGKGGRLIESVRKVFKFGG